MALEIERKFLCSLTKEQAIAMSFDSRKIESIYLSNALQESFRIVRNTSADGIKSCRWTRKVSTDDSAVRIEIEEELPVIIFNNIDLYKSPAVVKERFLINIDGFTWEVDFFDNFDFVIAELEFKDIESAKSFTNFPSWILEEVTDNPDYLNCNLARYNLLKA